MITAFSSGGGGGDILPPCDVQKGYTWYANSDNVLLCVQCYRGCQMCNNGDMNQCTQCFTWYYPLGGICLPRTPLVTGDQSFILNFENSMKLGMDETQNLVIGANGGNVYPNLDANDPIPSISRGYYFLQNSYMHSQGLNLSPWFTIAFWVKPMYQGRFFNKINNSYNTTQFIEISGKGELSYEVTLLNQEIISLYWSSESLIGSWHYIAITCTLDTITTYFQVFVDGLKVKESSIYNTLYDDPADTYFGNEPSGGTFAGFIWRVVIYGNGNHALDDFSSSNCNSGCSFCSQNLACPDNCELTQFNNNGKCTDCKNDCHYGCRNIESCNLCVKQECLTCDTFDGCNSCVEGATLTNSVCTCDSGKAFNGVKCDFCDVFCGSCTSSKYFSCSSCLDNYYLAGQTCLKEIPYGWDISQNSPYLVIDEGFETETFKGSYGIFITGENINTFAPFSSPEIYDPIPMVKRGLYFDNGAYLKSNIPIYLPYEFTMNLWVKPKNGDFLEKSDKIIITYNLHAAITLENYLDTQFSLVTNDATSFSDWTFYSLVIAFSNSATTVAAFTNGNSFFNRVYDKSLFRDLPSNYIILGKSTNSNFTGFIYSFTLMIGAVTDFSNVWDPSWLDMASGILSVCDFNYYYDASSSSCKACNLSCAMGCVRSSSCNLCADQLCDVCSSFSDGSCTTCKENANGAVCSCNADSILLKSSWICDKCDNGYCGECSYREAVYFNCKACIKGFLFKSVCLDEIPYGYDEQNCSTLPCPMFKINFEADFSGSYGIFDTSDSSSRFYYWNSPDLYDPIPVKDRGLYFDSGKYLISRSKIYFPHTFSIVSWINSYGYGDILEKDGEITIENNFSVKIHLSDAYQHGILRATQGSALINSWNFFLLSISFSNGMTSGSAYLNGDQIGTVSPMNYIFKDISGYLTLGKSKNSNFKGFIYNFEFYLGALASSHLSELKTCTPSNTADCLSPCNIFEFFDGGCVACNSSCPNSCVKANSCSICKDPLCKRCPGFGDGPCIECVENAQGSACECNSDSILLKDDIDWSCKKCDPDYCKECKMRENAYFSCNKCSKGILFQEACLDEKPYGIDGCSAFPCLVINAEFESDFKGSYDVFSTCNNPNTFYFWNNSDACDPVPAKDRGFYFNGSQYLISNSLYLSHTFSIVSWINSYGIGDIFEKKQRMKVGSDFSVAITLTNSTHGNFEKLAGSSKMEGWIRFELAVNFLDGTQTVAISFNGNQLSKLSEPRSLYRDVSSNLIIGKSGTSYFKGFIYDFKLFIGLINDPSLYSDKPICALGIENPCLSPCGFYEFYDNGCNACNTSCLNGCVRPKSCNICSDRLCINCPGFSYGSCNECVTNAQGSVCACNSDSILIKYEIDWACEKCDIGYCKVCEKREETYFDCKECETGHLIHGICLDEVPYGYENNDCFDSACLVINAEFEAEFSGTYDVFSTCGNSSTFNYWHDPEDCDPVPIKGRGLHFYSDQFLVSDKPLYFSHTFSIVLWMNSNEDGSIIEKESRIHFHSNFSARVSLINPFQTALLSQSAIVSSSEWNLFTLVVNYFNGSTTISTYINEAQASLNSYSQYLFRDKLSHLYIGKGTSSGFAGFIFSFKLFIGQISKKGTDIDSVCLSESDKNCIAPCSLTEYFNGNCKSCNSSCTLNCVRAPSCNICADQLCLKCSGFRDYSYCEQCTDRAHGIEKCECDSNAIFVETIYDQKCEYCDLLYCETCSTDKWFDCSECKKGVLVGPVCLDEYPYGYNSSDEEEYIIVDAEFSKEFGDYNIFMTGNNQSQYYFYKDPEVDFDPLPAIKRGLYFENDRFIKTNQKIYLSHSFSIGIWINPQTVDTIVNKEEKFVFLSNGALSIILSDPLGKEMPISTPQSNYTLSWYYLSFSVSYSDGGTTIYSYINNMQYHSASHDKTIFRDISSYMTIGNSSFTGFIYNLKVYIGAVYDFIGYSEVSLCQTIESENCISTCELFDYPDGSTCKHCNSTCGRTCVRYPSCKLCSDQLCEECSGFSSNSTCYQCIIRAHNLNNQTCICDNNAILINDGSDYFCEYCDLDYCSVCAGQGNFTCLECAKGELIDYVCLGEYPTGYEECYGKELCIMAEIDSENNFNETYGLFIAGDEKATYNPFNSPEIGDPVLAKDRGFFFDGNFSFLQSEQPYYFPHIFSLGMWILNLGTGDILEQGDRLLLKSNGSLSITLQDRFSKDYTFQMPGSEFKGWNFLSYSISYSNSTTSMKTFLNNIEAASQEFPNLLFRDISNSTLFIGKSSKSYFEGFLYKLQIWNLARNNFDDAVGNKICGLSIFKDCLSPCKLNQFYSEIHDRCKSCLISCHKGCIRDDTCNICEDPLCAVCPNFGKTHCIQCIPYASGVEKCKCIEKYCLSLDRLNCIKVPYMNSPELYWTHSIPEEKIIVGNWSGNFFINTIHDFITNVELLNSTEFSLSSNNCSFSPYSENFTCSFMLSVRSDYNISYNPLEVQVQYQGYLYPIYFNAFYDDFLIYLMNHQQLINIKYYFEISYLKIKLDSQLAFTDQFCLDDSCSATECNKILSKDSIIAFGSSITCFRISKSEMEIYLGHIQDSAKSLTFIENVLTDSNTNETNLAYIALNIKEEKPPQPKASITQIGSICCSCALTLDGSRSSGMGNLTFKWYLSKALRYSGDLNQRISAIILESCEMAKELNSFDVTLTVTDKFGQSDSAWTSVNMIYDEVAITIANKETLNIGTDSPLKLKFQYQKSTKIDLDPNPGISWSVSKNNRQLSEDIDYCASGIEFTHLFSVLGEYVVTANVLFNHGTYARSASVKVVATPPPPNLMVLGVNTTVYSNSYITVNLTATYGSDEIYPLKNGSVKFTETICSYGKFVEISGDSFNLRISNKALYFICNFTISLVDYPSVIGNHWVFVSPGTAPKVYIITKYPFLDWSSPVRILAHIENEMKTDISWGEANNQTFTPTTPTDQAGITIKEFSLIPGTEYEFTVTVIDKETFARTKVSLKRYVNCPPNGGTFEIDHNSEGITLETEFGILFSGWSDPEGNEPLSYQIFIKLKDNIRALIPKTTENKFTIKLGIIGEAILLGRVYDSYGTFIEIESTVSLNNTSAVSITSFTENLAANGTETMDSSLLISSITATGLYISETVNNEEETNDSISNSVDTLTKWMNNSMKSTSLSDSSTVIDCVNILLGNNEYLNETTLVKLHQTQDKALNKTKSLDTHTYMATLPNIDLVMKNLGSLLDKNSSDFTEIKIHSLVNKTYSEASLKYLIPANPNEEPMNYIGEKFNSTCRSVNGHSIANNIAYNSSKPNTDAQFIVDTSKNSDSTIYLLSVLTLNPFKSISDGLQKEAVSSYSYSEPFTASDESFEIKSPDTQVNSNFAYSDQYESSLVQVGISQNINSIFSPVITDPSLTSVSVMVGYDAYDKDLHMTCSVYLQQISQFSFKFCETYINAPGVATCKCEIVGLIMIPPYPSVLRNVQDRIDSVMIDIPKVGAIPVFIIFGSLLLVFYIAWLDISALERKYADPLKKLTLNINEIIAEEISMLSNNLYVNKEKINIDRLMQIWELGEIYEIENEWIESEERKENYEDAGLERHEVYPYFKKQLRNKLESIIKDQSIMNSLLTFERILMHIENCIDKRNLEDIEVIIDELFNMKDEENEKFVLWTQRLYKKKSGFATLASKIKQKRLRKILRASYRPIKYLSNSIEIFKRKIKYKHYNFIIQAVKKSILRTTEDSPEKDITDIKIKCESKEILINSIKKLEGSMFTYIKLRAPTLKLERIIKKWIFISWKESVSQSEEKGVFIRNDLSRKETNIPLGQPIVDYNDICIEGLDSEQEGTVEKLNGNEDTAISFSILPRFFAKLVEHQIDNFTPPVTFVEFFMENNDIFGIIGNTDLNFSRKGRLIYLIAAISTEIAIAISAFDGYTKYINNNVDLIIKFPEITLIIWFVSFILGFLPLFLKFFLKDRFLKSQLVKNKNDPAKNWKVFIGYSLSFSWIAGCWFYSFEKLNNYPISNIGAYLLYILQTLISFLVINGLILPAILATAEMYCCFKFVNWRIKRWVNFFKRIVSKNKEMQVLPTTDYEFSNRE